MKYSKDYYKILGVPENASADAIKKEYRKLAVRYHPDKNKGNKQAEEKFKEVSEAYYVLSDSKRRAEFDQFRKFGGTDPRGFQGAQGFNFEDLLRAYGGGGTRGARSSQSYAGFADIFEELFGGAGGRGRSASFDFFSGGYGGGASPGFEAAESIDERGVLKISKERARTGGAVKIRAKSGKTIAVKIPAGAKNGMKLRLAGLGKVSAVSGQRGDLILELKVAG